MSGKSSSRKNSFIYAFHGIKQLFISEPNARIHFILMLSVLAASVYFNITTYEWLLLVFCFGMVFTAELFNTALEFLCDHVTPEKHPNIKRVKDLAAAAVLVSALTSLIIGIVIFLPYLYQE